MEFARRFYLSKLGFLITVVQTFFSVLTRPFMVYGFIHKGNYYKRTRISSNVVILGRNNLNIEDNCWVWHHSILDATNGITIGRGSQIGAWVGIFTHSSHIAVRLYGEKYIEVPKEKRIGYERGSVEIGEYSFIGAGSFVLPGVKIGKGCVVAAGSIVSKSVPDFSIVAGSPAKVIGSTWALDIKFFDNKTVQECYFDQEKIAEWLRDNKQ